MPVAVVTGASGFVGQQVCRRLVADGWTVRALVRSAGAAPAGSSAVHYRGLDDAPALGTALAGADAVVHLAARVHVMRDRAADPLAAFRAVNVAGTAALLEAMARAGVHRLVHASSVKAVAERSTTPLRASTTPAPRDPYGVSKLEAERLVADWAAHSTRSADVLRLPLVYGPGARANILRLFRLVRTGLPVPVARARNRRSLVYVGNVAAAVAHLLRAALPAGARCSVLADGPAVSTEELVRAIADALGRPARVLALPEPILAAAARVGDALATVAPWPLTTAALERLTSSLEVDEAEPLRLYGFRPPFTLRDGLRETARWYAAVPPPGGDAA